MGYGQQRVFRLINHKGLKVFGIENNVRYQGYRSRQGVTSNGIERHFFAGFHDLYIRFKHSRGVSFVVLPTANLAVW